jgi:hypothetical protein
MSRHSVLIFLKTLSTLQLVMMCFSILTVAEVLYFSGINLICCKFSCSGRYFIKYSSSYLCCKNWADTTRDFTVNLIIWHLMSCMPTLSVMLRTLNIRFRWQHLIASSMQLLFEFWSLACWTLGTKFQCQRIHLHSDPTSTNDHNWV